MVVRKRAKHEGFRGKRHYHGSHKKHKGAGSRGGRGQAGLRRHKRHWMQANDPQHFGKYGFKRHASVIRNLKSINLRELDLMAEKLLKKNLAEEQDKKIKINLEKIGYDKLLGAGKVSKALIVEARYFSKSASKKLEEAGGKAVKLE